MSQRSENIESSQFPNPSNRASECGGSGSFQIVCWKFGMEEASFYVQSKGHNAGRPLNSPIPNSWAVFSDIPHLKEIAFSLFKSGKLSELQTGSVIPFIRLSEYRPILERAANQAQAYNLENLRTLALIEAQTEVIGKQLDLLSQYQTALAYKINSELKIFPKR
jgi:hypothetical protein